MRRGRQDGEVTLYGYFSQSFLTFKGAKMHDNKRFEDYKERVGQEIRLSGATSTYKNLDVAMRFTRCALEYQHETGKSVLFVYLF